MRPVRSSVILALSLSVAAVGLTACGESDDGASASASKYVDGKTFTLALSADPGALDPQGSASSPLFQVTQVRLRHPGLGRRQGAGRLGPRVEVVGRTARP